MRRKLFHKLFIHCLVSSWGSHCTRVLLQNCRRFLRQVTQGVNREQECTVAGLIVSTKLASMMKQRSGGARRKIEEAKKKKGNASHLQIHRRKKIKVVGGNKRHHMCAPQAAPLRIPSVWRKIPLIMIAFWAVVCGISVKVVSPHISYFPGGALIGLSRIISFEQLRRGSLRGFHWMQKRGPKQASD